jgi:phosphoglycolate phosphatase
MPLRAILFDKDGTLVDFDKTWGMAIFHAMTALSRSEDQMARLAEAIDYDLPRRRIKPHSPLVAGSTGDYAALWARPLERKADEAFVVELDHLCLTYSLQDVAPIGDPRAVLGSLKQAGFRVGVLTNDSERGARSQCEKLGLIEFLDVIVGYDSGHGRKPAPDPLHAISALLGIDPTDMALVGDSLHDLHAARAAGAVGIGVLSGHADADALGPHADHLIDDIMALPTLLDRIR